MTKREKEKELKAVKRSPELHRTGPACTSFPGASRASSRAAFLLSNTTAEGQAAEEVGERENQAAGKHCVARSPELHCCGLGEFLSSR